MHQEKKKWSPLDKASLRQAEAAHQAEVGLDLGASRVGRLGSRNATSMLRLAVLTGLVSLQSTGRCYQWCQGPACCYCNNAGSLAQAS